MMTNENDEEIKVTFWTYKSYFGEYWGGWRFYLIYTFVMFLFVGFKTGGDYFIGLWAQSSDQRADLTYYGCLTFAFSTAVSISIAWRSYLVLIANWGATRKLHMDMISKVLDAPVNLYFDVTPIGAILNRFSKDLNQLETQQGFLISSISQSVILLIQILAVAVYSSYWILLIVPVFAFMCLRLVNQTIRALQETSRLFSTTKSPLLSHMSETQSGSSTIRAFERQKSFETTNNKFLNDNINSTLMMSAVNSYFSVRLDLVSCLITLVLTISCVVLRDEANPIMLSLLLTYSLNIQIYLYSLLRWYMNLESQMVICTRCLKFKDVVQERDDGDASLLHDRPHWPERGKVVVRNARLRYRPDTEEVLRGISFEVMPNEKVGIVGRTGAGKSTICLGLSRIVEIHGGSIEIDGINI